MTHELQPLFNVNSNGEILDYDFISEENFLLLVALTNKGESFNFFNKSNLFRQSNHSSSLKQPAKM
jgi:hypothetical protein